MATKALTDTNDNNDNQYYTVIRVKRKYIDDPNRQDRYDDCQSSNNGNSNKRLRHLGSFSQKHDETSLRSQNFLQKMGFKQPKRIRFNDFDDDEQFSTFLNSDKDNSSKKPKSDNDEEKENDILNIELPPNDMIDENQPKNDQQKQVEESIVTCNGQPMISIKSNENEMLLNRQEKYLYDYYILLDDLIDFVEQDKKNNYDIDGNELNDNNNNYDDDEEPSSNDENYRYNDYPDEDEFSDDDEEDKDTDNTDNEKNDDDYENEFDLDEYQDNDMYNLCDEFDRFYRNNNDNDDDRYDGDSDDDDDDDNEYDREYGNRIIHFKR